MARLVRWARDVSYWLQWFVARAVETWWDRRDRRQLLDEVAQLRAEKAELKARTEGCTTGPYRRADDSMYGARW